MADFKRLKVEERSERISWRNPKFADWKLNWSSDSASEVKSWDVHRVVLVGGQSLAFHGACQFPALAAESSLLLTVDGPIETTHGDLALDGGNAFVQSAARALSLNITARTQDKKDTTCTEEGEG